VPIAAEREKRQARVELAFPWNLDMNVAKKVQLLDEMFMATRRDRSFCNSFCPVDVGKTFRAQRLIRAYFLKPKRIAEFASVCATTTGSKSPIRRSPAGCSGSACVVHVPSRPLWLACGNEGRMSDHGVDESIGYRQ